MSRLSFTRDEVILALDLLFSSEKGRVYADSEEMADLSALLNRLPIHPIKSRRDVFRNPTGITRQINLLRTSLNTGNRITNLGAMFVEIADEFNGHHDELHKIAEAIRRNEHCFTEEYGSSYEDVGFQEGILLGHLHRVIENRDGIKYELADHCEICSLKPELCYQPCGGLLQPHLVIPPTELDGNKQYGVKQFITVCPTCHAVLHRFRPWRTKDNCEEILR